MIAAHENASPCQRFALPDMLQVARSLMFWPAFRDTPCEVAFVDSPGLRKVVRAHRGAPVKVDQFREPLLLTNEPERMATVPAPRAELSVQLHDKSIVPLLS